MRQVGVAKLYDEKEKFEIAHAGLEKVVEEMCVTVSSKKLRIDREFQKATKFISITLKYRRGKSLVVQISKVVTNRPVVDGIATVDHQRLHRQIRGGVLLIICRSANTSALLEYIEDIAGT